MVLPLENHRTRQKECQVNFGTRTSCYVFKSTILRSSESDIVANLTTGITLKRMMAEQIRIRQMYPPVAGKSEGGEATA
jgi:hypothetical protein